MRKKYKAQIIGFDTDDVVIISKEVYALAICKNTRKEIDFLARI